MWEELLTAYGSFCSQSRQFRGEVRSIARRNVWNAAFLIWIRVTEVPRHWRRVRRTSNYLWQFLLAVKSILQRSIKFHVEKRQIQVFFIWIWVAAGLRLLVSLKYKILLFWFLRLLTQENGVSVIIISNCPCQFPFAAKEVSWKSRKFHAKKCLKYSISHMDLSRAEQWHGN